MTQEKKSSKNVACKEKQRIFAGTQSYSEMKRHFAERMTILLLGGCLVLASCGSHKTTSADKPKNEDKSMIAEFSKRKEIHVIEDDNGYKRLELFSMDCDEGDAYFLSVGSLGYGDDIVQVYVDPIHELFIPLGSTLEEAEAMLQQLKDFSEQPKGATTEITGCLGMFIPDDNLEKVTLTHTQSLLDNQIRFCVEREGELRATFVSRSDISSMLSSLKWYRKIHPKKK